MSLHVLFCTLLQLRKTCQKQNEQYYWNWWNVIWDHRFKSSFNFSSTTWKTVLTVKKLSLCHMLLNILNKYCVWFGVSFTHNLLFGNGMIYFSLSRSSRKIEMLLAVKKNKTLKFHEFRFLSFLGSAHLTLYENI